MPRKTLDLSENPAMGFINTAEKVEEFDKERDNPIHSSNQSIKDDIFNQPKKECKSKRLQLLVKPSTYKAISKLAKDNKTSVNEAVNLILEHYIKEKL